MDFFSSFNDQPTIKREHKGKSLIALPTDYTIIDIETTGLDSPYYEIIEVSAIKCRNNEIIDTFSSLVNEGDCYIDNFIRRLTGITQEMIDVAPPANEVLSKYFEFIGNDLVIGHNVNFDINFLYDRSEKYFKKYFTNDFIDTLRLARKKLPELEHHRLEDLCVYYNLEPRGKHRADNDCQLAYIIYNKIRNSIDDEESFIKSFSKSHLKPNAKDIKASAEAEFQPDNMLYGKVCVFTGTLEKMQRKDAMQAVVNIGGLVGNGVTSKTNYLIMGNNDLCKTIKEGKSNKQKKAEALILEGKDLSIISEDLFYELIGINE